MIGLGKGWIGRKGHTRKGIRKSLCFRPELLLMDKRVFVFEREGVERHFTEHGQNVSRPRRYHLLFALV